MTEPDTDTDDDRTDDQFDTTIDARDVDDQTPPAACRGCGREVTLLGNGFCGFCQDRDGADDEDGPSPRPDGGTTSAPPADGPAKRDDWERAAAVAVDADDLVRCGDWLAVRRDDVILGTSDDGARAAMAVPDAQTLGVTARTSGRTTVQAGDIQVDALEVDAVRVDGGDQQNAQDDVAAAPADGADLAKPDPADARRAVVDAARYDGMTVIRGAYQARRTIFEPWPKGKPGVTRQAVKLDARTGPGRSEFVAYVTVTPFQALRDDWGRPSPVDPGDVVLPADDFDVVDLFPSPAMLPGQPGDADDGGDA